LDEDVQRVVRGLVFASIILIGVFPKDDLTNRISAVVLALGILASYEAYVCFQLRRQGKSCLIEFLYTAGMSVLIAYLFLIR